MGVERGGKGGDLALERGGGLDGGRQLLLHGLGIPGGTQGPLQRCQRVLQIRTLPPQLRCLRPTNTTRFLDNAGSPQRTAHRLRESIYLTVPEVRTPEARLGRISAVG